MSILNRNRLGSNDDHARSPQDLNAALQQSSDVDSAADHFGQLANPSFIRPAEEKLRPLASLERDLFETFIENPDLAITAVEAIDPDWFETNTAKMLLTAYQDLEFDGHQLDIESVLLLVENEQLKNQLVTLQERVRKREESYHKPRNNGTTR